MRKITVLHATLLAAIMLTLPAATLFAQPGDKMGKFHEEKISFFTEKLDMSDKEADKFWPVHEDFHNRNMKINEEERILLDYYNSNYEAMSDEEVHEHLEKYIALQKKRVELGAKYHMKFIEILGERKTMRMYALDREFRKHILRQFRAGHGGGRGRARCPVLEMPE